MGKGIVLESSGRQGIVLTPDGEFRRVKLPSDSQVGDEVTYADVLPFPVWRWMAVAAAIVALAVIPLAATQTVFGSTVAVVALDINPSLEFDINDGGRVIRARALNPDGGDVLRDLSYRRQPVEVAVERATDLSIRKGYLQPKDMTSSVLVTVTALAGSADEEAVDEVQVRVVTSVQGLLVRHQAQTQAYGLKATQAERQEAQELKVPVARYLLYQAARLVDPEVTLPDVVQVPPGQISKVVKKLDLKALLRIVTEQHDEKVKEEKVKAEKSKEEKSVPAGREKSGGLLRSLFPSRMDDPKDSGRPGGSGKVDAPGKGVPGKEAPGKEAPGKEAPGKEAPGREAPGREAPGREAPGKEAPGKEAPGREAPGREAPGKSGDGQAPPGRNDERKDGGHPAGDQRGRGSGSGSERPPEGGLQIGVGIGSGNGSRDSAPGGGRSNDVPPSRGR